MTGKKVWGDFLVKRVLTSEVRADRGLRVATITTNETLDLNSYSWQKLTNNTSSLDVSLPDATTLPIKGWSQVVENPIASSFDLVVKDGAGTILKTVVPGTAYEFTCEDIGSAAGVWFVTSLGDDTVLAASRYSQDFDNATDWGSPSAGAYTITITEVVHTRGLNPQVTVLEVVGDIETEVDVEVSYDKTTGDVSIAVPQTPDCRFAGRVLII